MGTLAWLPALIGAAVSVGLVKSSLLGFLFLLPLGVVAYCFNAKTAWFAALLAVLGNFAFSLPAIGVDVLCLAALIAIFTWITSPPERAPAFFRMPVVYRFMAGSVLATLVFALVLYSMREDQELFSIFRQQAEALASLYAASAGADVVQRSLTEQYMTADTILKTLGAVALRGGMLVSWVLLFFVSRQISLVITWMVRRILQRSSPLKRPDGSLVSFHLRPECIWALSFSLLAILAGLRLKLTPLEIAGWNVLVLCIILYLTQGGGIVLFFLTRALIPPGMRFVLNLVIFVVILSPGINAVFLVVLVLLGIAENWVPFRAPKTNGSPPTPEV
ncbi:hypothetical protein [Treponema primitia]|uniref:hypothetical protein n=1 Tax=Treponema primitia TaxID=88058 RepID=UPI00025558D6|nr:hypothetical protein [Treponema primitia]